MLKVYKRLLAVLCCVVGLGQLSACQQDESGPGMIISFGSVISGKRISVNSTKLPNGKPFSSPGSVGGSGTQKWGAWRNIPTAVMAVSGDYRGLPEWVEFEWQETDYPGLEPSDFPDRAAFSKYVRDMYAKLPIKTQRLEIKSRIPQEVVDEVIESKRNAKRGELAEKSLWLYIFWTPDGVKMRWALKYDEGRRQRNFGDTIKQGGDDLDRYNR